MGNQFMCDNDAYKGHGERNGSKCDYIALNAARLNVTSIGQQDQENHSLLETSE